MVRSLAFSKLAELTIASDYQHLVTSSGANKIGAQGADQADYDRAKYRTPEAHDLKAIHKPAGEIEHARIEHQQKQAESQNGERESE